MRMRVQAAWVRGRMARRLLALLVVPLAVGCGTPPPDLLVVGGRVFTADPQQPWVEAVAIRGARVTAVGARTALEAQAGPQTRRLDATGRVVVPGFNDAHVRLDGTPSVARVRALAATALRLGVTSMQLVSDAPVADTVTAVRDAGTPVRWRIVRMPTAVADGWRDGKTFVPPQPGPRIDVKGAAWRLAALSPAQRLMAVQWAYGPDDPLHLDARDGGDIDAVLLALGQTGLPEIWARKRPRLEFPTTLTGGLTGRLAAFGVVVVQGPPPVRGPGLPVEARPLGGLLAAGVPLALASGHTPSSGAVLAWALTAGASAGEALTPEQAVTALTRGASYAEGSERDKGWLGPGALADLAVLSDDPFAGEPSRLAGLTSVATVVGGRVVVP